MSKVDLKSKEAELIRARDAVLTDETTRKYVIFGEIGCPDKEVAC